jgi:RNA methyltransferase, TrmH family
MMLNKIINITSPDNQHLKNLKALWDNRKRKKSGLFFAEGLKEISMAVEGGYEMTGLYISENFDININELNVVIPGDALVCRLSANLSKDVMYREKTEGITAVFKARNLNPGEVKLSENPLIIILESVEKPGNLGAVIRTADACNADAVVVCDPRTDIFHPNVIRSSVGCVFSKQVLAMSNDEALEWMRSRKISVIAASVQSKTFYFDADLAKPVAIVFGTEADGLSNFWNKNCNQSVKIPMLGINDSLNVSVSVAVMCYEAVRKRMK